MFITKLNKMGKTVKRTLTPENGVAILKGYGTIITPEEAQIMLGFGYEFAQLAKKVQIQEKQKEQWMLDRMTTSGKN